MKINLAKSAGFCFGVKRAINIALKTLTGRRKAYILGDIVHNEEVIKEIEKAGIKKIKKLSNGKNKVLLLRAHGTSVDTFRKARRLGYKIIDATCPMVKEIHKIAKGMEKKGYRIIVIGDKKHDEVRGIIGQLRKRAVIIDGIKNIPLKIIKGIKKACVVAQSTQNLDNVLKIFNILKMHIPDLQFFNTICKPTRMKQEEIRHMPKVNDVMIIIGSKKSANTKRLYEISKSLNKKSYWINSKRQIKPEWLKKTETVGITAGASTPESAIKEVMGYLRRLN
jgi:4-hydroxy-3-methylbut-2-enyl diphosphate reductase